MQAYSAAGALLLLTLLAGCGSEKTVVATHEDHCECTCKGCLCKPDGACECDKCSCKKEDHKQGPSGHDGPSGSGCEGGACDPH